MASREATGIACNVLKWEDQVKMFVSPPFKLVLNSIPSELQFDAYYSFVPYDWQRHAIDTYGKVDIVFANAGTSSETDNPLISDAVDENGEPKVSSRTVQLFSSDSKD